MDSKSEEKASINSKLIPKCIVILTLKSSTQHLFTALCSPSSLPFKSSKTLRFWDSMRSLQNRFDFSSIYLNNDDTIRNQFHRKSQHSQSTSHPNAICHYQYISLIGKSHELQLNPKIACKTYESVSQWLKSCRRWRWKSL